MSAGRRLACQTLLLAAALITASALAGAAPASAQAPLPSVSAFPIPGDLVASPQTQIAFRGIPASELGTIQVTGSSSGVHTGTIEADSDGDGGSFIPSKPFVAGESVTVKTSLNIVKAAHFGVFHFTIAQPAAVPVYAGSIRAPRVPGDVWTFHSEPNLTPAAVSISTRRGNGGGTSDIFLTPQYGPLQNGPEIVSPSGRLIWFDPLPAGNMASDFEVQSYHGEPVLTWWQGYSSQALGVGVDEIYNTSYQPVAVVHAANGLNADLHEFQITPQGTALITAYYPVYWNATSVHGSSHQIVYDCVVQEIDIPTGLVLYQWDSLDHVPITGSYTGVTRNGGAWDYFHLNSIQQDDGNYLISARNTWAAYKISSTTGQVLWSLGGKWSNFRMERGASFAFQHDVQDQSSNDHWITVFDDGGGLPNVHPQSRGIDLWVDFNNHTAWVGSQWFHSPSLMTEFEGNVQQLANDYHFIGWGEKPYFTEYDRRGRVILDGHFISQTASYRAYRFSWSGSPSAPPALVGSSGGGQMTLYMSWNGATNAVSWRVLGGASPGALRTLTTVPDNSFETSATVPEQQYAEVQALDSHGNVLGTSAAVNIG